MDNKERKEGFSLIETFVAITILIIAVIGPMTLFSRAIADGIFAKNQVIAFYLAQEGLELAIDHRNYEGKWWTSFSCEDGCSITWQDSDGADLQTGNRGPLLYNSATGEYNYTSGRASMFSRQIFTEIQNIDDPWNPNAGVRVTSTVFWSYLGTARETSISTLLFRNAE